MFQMEQVCRKETHLNFVSLLFFAFRFNLAPGQIVRMGQKIGCVGEDDSDDTSSMSDDPHVKSL
jgi:hypothetical protein